MKQRGLLDRFFYLFMAVLIAGVVAYGFSFTVRRNLLSPDVPRPPVLYVHAVFFSAWLLFFILQAALALLDELTSTGAIVSREGS